MRLSIMLIVLLAVSAICSAQTTWYVPDDYLTIQEAIDAAVNGDTVLVAPGTYVENIDFKGKAIIVTSVNGPASTFIDGNQEGSVVVFNTGEGPDSILEGFTVTNGSGTVNPVGNLTGGGIYCWDAAPKITGNIISDNSADWGAGFFCNNHYTSPFPILAENTISGNSAQGGGGVMSAQSSLEITGNTVTENTAYDGGGIYCGHSSPIITNNHIYGNTATSYHGGGIAFFFDSTGIVSENTISGNSAHWSGGGIYCNDSSPTITNNTISENSAEQAGGGIYCYDSSPTITNNTISGNTTDREGAGILCEVGSSPWIENNTITNNQAKHFGGGIEYFSACSPTIINNVIIHNEATLYDGGGIVVSTNNCSGTIINNLIAGNSAGRYGGGVDCDVDCSPTLMNNTIYGNSAATKGGGLSIRNNCDLKAVNTILWGNKATGGPEIWIASTAGPSVLTISYSNLEGGQASVLTAPGCTLNWGPGMIDSDPLLVDPVNGDFHLTFNSPCWGSGDNSAPYLPDYDFEGDPRIAYGTVDMGADEFHPHLYFTGDAIPSGTIQAKFVGLPGTLINGVILGVNIFDPPLPCDYGLWYMDNPFQVITGLGAIPADGVSVIPGTIPASPVGPYTIYLQAAIDSWLTNLCTVNVE